ncbi:hypothetical protein [Nitrosopumilus ureiphilus]|nr:hypothetical protein [Nitrosopumilus ureiphilus]
MALREIKPLDEKDWNTLISDLEQGQTEEQMKILQNSLEHASKLKISQ